ncbi:MAG: HDIG domain-containing protein [Desulfocapsaceae bacterium]|nr:HDIG domain-containing protein [Desulfocapsaceae bacterium]
MSYQQYGISREDALDLLRTRVKNENMFKHCLAAEAVLKAMARRLGEDENKWGLAGLLHDLDAESQPDLATHTQETAEILNEKGIDPEIIDAIRLHNLQAHPGESRTTPFQHGLAAGETITGLVIATALVNPAKRLAAVKPKSVRKRIKEKAFARGADREIIKECEQAGIPLADFCALSLAAMQEIADDLGL